MRVEQAIATLDGRIKGIKYVPCFCSTNTPTFLLDNLNTALSKGVFILNTGTSPDVHV